MLAVRNTQGACQAPRCTGRARSASRVARCIVVSDGTAHVCRTVEGRGYTAFAYNADDQQLDEKVKHYCQLLLTSAPGACQDVKKAILYECNHSHEQNEEYVQKLFQKMMRSTEAAKGLAAFRQKKKPQWWKHSKM